MTFPGSFEPPDRGWASYPDDINLGAFLQRENYSLAFIEDHIVPMGAAIWSTPMQEMLGFPARSFVDFYANHGMLQFENRPAWRTVSGGSKEYVTKIAEDGGFEIQLENCVEQIVRHPGYVRVADGRGVVRPFDHVVVATHADHALSLLDEPDQLEHKLLGSFSYQANRAVLHRDSRWMPRRRRMWSSWNYLKSLNGPESALCLSYWMNRLQVLRQKQISLSL